MVRPAVVLAVAAGISACYSYRPLPQANPIRGTAVRVDIGPEATERLANVLGPRVSQIDGRMGLVQADTVQLLVRVARTPDLVEYYFKDEPIQLPRTAIVGMQQRKLAAGSTAALSGLLAAGAVAAAAALTGDAGTGSPPTGGPVNPE